MSKRNLGFWGAGCLLFMLAVGPLHAEAEMATQTDAKKSSPAKVHADHGMVLFSSTEEANGLRGETWDLWHFYEEAVKEDSVLKSVEAGRWVNRAVLRQKQANLYPKVQATVSRIANAASAINHYYNGQALNLTLTQPLIVFANWADAKYGRDFDQQGEVNYLWAQQNLIIRVAEAYFGLLKTMDALEASRSERMAYERYLEQTTQKYKVGLIAVTDVEIAKARRDNAAAAEIAAANAIEDQRGVLQALVNQSVQNVFRLQEDLPLVNPSPEDLDSWIIQALGDNYALQSARLDLALAKSTLKKNFSEHFPSLSLGGSLSKATTIYSGAELKPRQWTTSLNLNIPIFAGGGTQAKAAESAALYRQSAFDLETQHREVERLTQQYYRGVLSQIAQVKALQQALLSNQVALKATKAAFDVGTRTIVDVLNAESDLVKAEQDHKAATYEYLLQGLRLKQMSATLGPEDLKAINAWLVADQS